MSNLSRSELLGRREAVPDTDVSGVVPYPWEKHFDDEYQSYYYYNPVSQETRWADVNGKLPYTPKGRNNINFNQNTEEYEQDDPYELDEEYNLDELDGDASISNMSRLSQLSVIERSEFYVANKREKQEALRTQLLQREEEELRDPEINKRSKQLSRNVEDMFAWEEQRKARMEALAAQQRAAEDAQITGKPTLYASSNASVSSHNSGDGLPVEARLLAYEEKRKLKLQQTIAHEKNEARRSAIPTIAPHSAQLVQRRATAAARGEEAPQSSNRRVAAGDAPGILKDNATGQLFFQPKLNRKSELIAAQSRPNMPIEDLLAGKGKLLQQKQAERERRLEQRAQELRQVSKVNPHSNQLVQNRYILQGETTQDRLARPIGTVKQKTLEEIEKPSFKPTLNPVSLEMTANNGYNNGYSNGYGSQSGNNNNRNNEESAPYSPQEEALHRFNSMYSNNDFSFDEGGEPLLYEDLLRGSHNGGSRNVSEPYMYNGSSHSLHGQASQQQQDAMYQKTQRWNEMRQQKLEKERKQRERKEREDCTFRPKIDASSAARSGRNSHNSSFTQHNNNNNNSYYQDDDGETEGGGGIDAYVERQLTWVEKKEQKLELERRKALEKELADCSFVPKVRANPNIQVTSSVSEIIKGQSSTNTSYNNQKHHIAPTNTTFGSNIASASGNTQSYHSSSNSTANVRRGGAGTAKVAYNANKARQSQWADEGPFYVTDDIPTGSNNAQSKNKYYTASNPYTVSSNEDVRYVDRHYQQENYQDESYGEEEEEVAPPAPPAPSASVPAPVRIKVPLPVKSTIGTNNPAMNQKSVHFSGQEDTHSHPGSNSAVYNHHYQPQNGDNRDYMEDSQESDYRDEGPHEVTVDYGQSPLSENSDNYASYQKTAPDAHHQYEQDQEHYNGLPFQVSANPSHRVGQRSSEGSPYSPNNSPGSPAASHGHIQRPPPHRLFPATPHQPPHQSYQDQQLQHPVAAARSSAPYGSFVEPEEEADYDTLPSPRGTVMPNTHITQPLRTQSHAPYNQGNHIDNRRMPHIYHDDVDRDSPPPPPPVVFRESQNSHRPAVRPPGAPPGAPPAGGPVSIPGIVPTGPVPINSHPFSTPYCAANRKELESQLLSPDEDW